MSNNRFTVDAVPTPNLNLAQAFEQDLQYYVKNGNKLPPLGKSQLKRIEEQLNTYLKFINEDFVLKGFTKGSVLTVQVINAGIIQSKDGSFIIDLDKATWTMVDANGDEIFSYSPANGLKVTGEIKADIGEIGGFGISKTALGGARLVLQTNGIIDIGTSLRLSHTSGNTPLIDGQSSLLQIQARGGVDVSSNGYTPLRVMPDGTVRVYNLYVDDVKYQGGGSGMSQIGEGYTTGSNVRMRAYPSTGAPETYQISSADSDIVVYGRGQDTSGYIWYYCRYDEDYIGWIREDLVYVVMG